MSDSNQINNQENLPDWIKQLRSQSWQIEMLIAGSAVYTLFYLSDHMQSLFYHIYPGIDFSLARALTLFGIYLVSRILLIGFTANLVIRSVWLAYLGINFTFPKGIDFDRLRNNEESKAMLRKQPSILDRVTLLERFAKLSYSLAILLALFMTSVFISTILIHVVLDKLNFDIIYSAWFSYSLAIFIAITQLGVIDRFFLAKKTKSSIVNAVKIKLSTFLEFATLSFLFRREFLAIKSNTNRWALGLSASLILALSSVITSYQIGKYWPYGTFELNILDDRKFYDLEFNPKLGLYNYDSNITSKTSVIKASIQSQIIKGRYLRLFITSWAIFDDDIEASLIKYSYPMKNTTKNAEDFFETKELADSIFNLVMNNLFEVKIDGVIQEKLRFKSTNHLISKVKGYVTFIDIESLNPEEHKLELFGKRIQEDGTNKKLKWKEIPFWKE